MAQPAPQPWRVIVSVSAGAVALAFDAATGRLAIGDARGLVLGLPGEALRRVSLRGPVRDVAFAGGGAGSLFAATAAGLFRVAADGDVRGVSLAPGHAARDITRIATAGAAVAVASADGVFVSLGGSNWRRASQRWPSGPASAVALRLADAGFECWAIIEGRVWSAELNVEAGGLREGAALQLVVPAAPTGNGPVDIAFDVAGSDAVVLFAEALAERPTREAQWRVLRPTLAPGARNQRIVAAAGRVWLATDRGLWSAPGLGTAFALGSAFGPGQRWTRATSPVGSEPVGDIVAQGARLFVAGESAVREARVGLPSEPLGAEPAEISATPTSHVASATLAPDTEPPIAALHRAVLAYVDLAPSHARALRRGVSRRAWWPEVSLSVDGGSDLDRDVDYDQAFVSGETRYLVDRTRRRERGFDAGITLRWDLGDIAYHPEAIDVSRESREVLKLRDDVLDEVNQLYFERRSLMQQLATSGSALATAERRRLRTRAAELSAGLDAWTGGWFGRAIAAPAP